MGGPSQGSQHLVGGLTHYERHRDEYAIRRRAQKIDLTALMRAAKAKPCADCGVSYPACVMDFDHVRGVKLFNLSNAANRGRLLIIDEIAKCDVVCANCHRLRTEERRTVAA